MARNVQPEMQHTLRHQWMISRTPERGELVRDRQWTGNNSLHCAVLRGDGDAVLLESQVVEVNEVNAKGETPLHLAARNKSDGGVQLIEMLLLKGGDVNCQNKWGQTPLHYAAIADCFDNLQRLTAVASVDVNIVDLNGYNALHCLICSDENPSLKFFGDTDEEEEVSPGLKQAIHVLVKAGTKINSQTKCGQTILHLASTRDNNSPLLKYILRNFPQIDLKAKNQMGENFLHVYAASEIFEEVSDLLVEVAEANLPIVRELLDDKNVLGRTPWTNMIDDANVSEEFIKKILSYGVSVNTVDNLGNTALHRIAGVSAGMFYSGIIDLLMEGGADITAENVYRESPGFVLFLRDVFDVFMKHGMDFNTRDRWGRSPLVSVMKHKPLPDLLRKLVVEGKGDVNGRDVRGSTPLHFAAYHNYPEQVELLRSFGADQNALDELGDKPLDTARRHCSLQCQKILDAGDQNASETPKNEEFVQILVNMPTSIPSSSIKSVQAVQTVLGLQENLDGFLDHLMTTFYLRPLEAAEEAEAVVSAVNALVESLCVQIAAYDSRFEMSVFPTGSNAEGTKVGRPDEFDFVLCLDKLNDKTEIFMTEECRETGYACLRFTETPLSEEYLPFSDVDGYFLALPFLQLFFKYAKRALNETEMWTTGNLYYNFEDKMVVLQGKPVFNFSVYWMGSTFKQLKVSIDLVPAVYKRGWWPPNIDVKEIPLMNERIFAAGCFLMLQTRTQDFDSKRHLLNDSVSHTCNVFGGESDFPKRRMLRISATPAEIALMKSLPETFRHAYALAKIVKTKEMCPEIEINELPTRSYLKQKKFQEQTPSPVKPSGLIKSYMLKNCIFYVLQEMRHGSKCDSGLKISEVAAKVYKCLLQFADERCLKPYFLPFSDVFLAEKEGPKSSYKEYMLQLSRELSLKLILGMLNHQFPEVCLASKSEGLLLC